MTAERKNVGDGEPSLYSCLQCSSKFKQKFNLTKHIKSVHNPEKFKCEQCASSFGRMDHLKRHKQMKHTLQKCEECVSFVYAFSNDPFSQIKIHTNHTSISLDYEPISYV